MTYLELVAAANSGDRKAIVELAIIEGRMLNAGLVRLVTGGWPGPASEIVLEQAEPAGG